MSDENSIEETDGDELEAMFARAALEEEQQTAQPPQEEMHDPLSSVMAESTEEEPEVALETLEEGPEEEAEVDFIGGAMDGETADLEIPDEMDEEDSDEQIQQ